MMTAKQAFGSVRSASDLVATRTLKLSELAKIKSETLGWKSDITKFRKEIEEQLVALPRGDKQKKVLRRQKADLSKAVSRLRDEITSATNELRLSRASKRDQKSVKRFEKARIQVVDAVRRMIEEDSDQAREFLLTQLARTEKTVDEPVEETIEL